MKTKIQSNIVVIGSSAGGPRILKELFRGLPLLNCSIVLVQHMPKFVNDSLANHMNQLTDMTIKIAENGERIKRGEVYVAPSEQHLELINNKIIRLFRGEKVNFVCPSVDVTMKSLKRMSDGKIVGVILTGMGKDGTEGISHIKAVGGVTIAQDEKTSIIHGMPREAFKTGNIDLVLSPVEIREKLVELLGVVNK